MKISENQRNMLIKNNHVSNRNTRHASHEALFALLKDKSYDKITITDIINTSGISRSAFYRNYKTKDDVLFEQINEVIREIMLSLTKSHFNNWVFIFQKTRDYSDKIDILVQSGLEYKIFEQLSSFPVPEDMDALSYHIWVGIIYSVLIDWVKRGMIETNEEMTFKTILSLNQIEKITKMQ